MILVSLRRRVAHDLVQKIDRCRRPDAADDAELERSLDLGRGIGDQVLCIHAMRIEQRHRPLSQFVRHQRQLGHAGQ